MPAEGYWSYTALKEAVDNGLLTGYDDGRSPPQTHARGDGRHHQPCVRKRGDGRISFSDVTESSGIIRCSEAVHMKTFDGMGDGSFAATPLSRGNSFYRNRPRDQAQRRHCRDYAALRCVGGIFLAAAASGHGQGRYVSGIQRLNRALISPVRNLSVM